MRFYPSSCMTYPTWICNFSVLALLSVPSTVPFTFATVLPVSVADFVVAF